MILRQYSPVYQNLTPSYDLKPGTLYQKFAFLNSVINTDEFSESVNRILSAPVTTWKEREKVADIRNITSIDSHETRQIASAFNRVILPETHPLSSITPTIPLRILSIEKHESLDTPENQFIKYAVSEFFYLCSSISQKFKDGSREKRESDQVSKFIANILDNPFFKEISTPYTLSINSPVLQRKEGYREIYLYWLMLDLASSLIWGGGDDVYSAGKKDVATLYEYWIFFKLLDLIGSIFKIEKNVFEKLIEQTDDGLNLMLKTGTCTAIRGSLVKGIRKLEFEFNYNRTFLGSNISNYPQQGSWTRSLRPDFTLSIWPSEFDKEEAERQELISHIHFDAKYRIEGINELFGPDIGAEYDNDSYLFQNEKKGTYKRTDLLKMHTYKDAIRRTAGAYVLYPGTENMQWRGFHEIIPGLGAFSIRPSSSDDGTSALKKFIVDVIEHLSNRSTQQERTSYHLYESHKDVPLFQIYESLPEVDMGVRAKPPIETSVLIGFYKDLHQYKWIKHNCLYNFRMDKTRGSLRLRREVADAKYILLHTEGQLITRDIWRVANQGPRVFSRQQMNKLGYINPSGDYYLVYDIDKEEVDDFGNAVWDVSKLNGYLGGRNSGMPFVVTLADLMQARVFEENH